jgi:hypothetical protein
MADSFSGVINEIMPLVKDGDTSTPFIIYRKTDDVSGSWFAAYPYPAENGAASLKQHRENDPCAVMFKGAAFDGGSFAFVHDKILCARLRAEYNNIPFGEVHGGEMQALISAVEDNIGTFLQDTVDYLLKFDNPLRELYELNPIPLWNRDGDNNEPYIEDNVTEFLEAVEYKIGELIKESEPPQKEQTKTRTDRGGEEKPDLLAKIKSNKQKVERNKAADAGAPAKKKNRSGQEV